MKKKFFLVFIFFFFLISFLFPFHRNHLLKTENLNVECGKGVKVYDVTEAFKNENNFYSNLFSSKSPTWGKVYYSDDYVEPCSIIHTSDGGYVIGGTWYSLYNVDSDFIMIKLNSDGEILWAKRWDTGSNNEVERGVLETSDGGFLIYGSYHTGVDDLVLLKVDSSGNLLWNRVYDDPEDQNASCLIFATDSGYIASGYGDNSFYLIKFDIDGNTVWKHKYNITDISNLSCITPTQDGGYLSGVNRNVNGNDEFLLVSVSSGGDLLWAHSYKVKDNSSASSIVHTPDGGFLVAGTCFTTGQSSDSYSFFLLKINSQGDVLWTKVYGDFLITESPQIIQSGDGMFYFMGSEVNRDYTSDIVIVKVNSSGEVLWFHTLSGGGMDEVKDAILLEDGGIVITGDTTSFGNGLGGIFTLRLNSDGFIVGCSCMDKRDVAEDSVLTTEENVNISHEIPSFSYVHANFSEKNFSPTTSLICPDEYTSSVWDRSFQGEKDDTGYFVVKTSDGGYALCGTTNSFSQSDQEAFIVKVNSQGGVVWSSTYGLNGRDFWPGSLVETGDDGFVTVGGYEDSGIYHPFAFKVDSGGNIVWAKYYNIEGEIYSIVSSLDGGYVMAGYTDEYGQGGNDFLIVKIDSSGNVQWAESYGESGDDTAHSVIRTSDNGYAIAGKGNEDDFLLLKIDGDGNFQWAGAYGTSDESGMEALSVEETSDGDFILAGNWYPDGFSDNFRTLVVKIGSDGSFKWGYIYSDREIPTLAYSISKTSDGNFVVAGGGYSAYSYSYAYSNLAGLLLKIDTNGNLIWYRGYGPILGGVITSVIQGSDGGFVFSLVQNILNSIPDTTLLKVDSNGRSCCKYTKSIPLGRTSLDITSFFPLSSSDLGPIAYMPGVDLPLSASSVDFPTSSVCPEEADLSITKSASPDPVYVGQEITYTITVSNGGPGDAEYVEVVDDIPAGINNVEYSVDGGTNWNSWEGSINIGTLSSGASYQILIRGVVESSAVGTLSNTAEVSSITGDPVAANNSATVNSTASLAADLSITKEGLPDPVNAGGVLTYTITVVNSGPNDAENVVVSDNLPSQLENPEYSLDGGSTWNPWSGSVNLGMVSNGGTSQVLIRVDVLPSMTGVISNSASVSSDTFDPDLSNNSASVDINVIGCDPQLICGVDDSCPYVGEDVTFRFHVLNNGHGFCDKVNVKTEIPAGFSILSYSGDGNFDEVSREWEVDDLSSGDGASLVIICREESEIGNHVECFDPEIYHVEPTDLDLSNNGCHLCVDMGKKSNSDIYIEGNVLNKLPAMGEDVEVNIVVGNGGIDPVYNIYGGIYLDGGINFIGYGGSDKVEVSYPYFRIDKINVGEEVHFWMKVKPMDVMEYHGDVYLDHELINDSNLSNNTDILRFSTRDIYRWIPGGKVEGVAETTPDFNGDGKVNIVDLYKLINIVVGNIPLGSGCINMYDLNDDGKVDGIDVLILRQYLSSRVY